MPIASSLPAPLACVLHHISLPNPLACAAALACESHTPPLLAGLHFRPDIPQFGVVANCPGCGRVGGGGHGAVLKCIVSRSSFKTQFNCVHCGGKVNVDTDSAAGSLAKALYCELAAAELLKTPSRNATQQAELQKYQDEAAGFRAKLPEALCVPAPDDGRLSLDLGETGERIKANIKKRATAKAAAAAATS